MTITLPFALLLCLGVAIPVGAQPQPPLKKANTVTPATTEKIGQYQFPGTPFTVSRPVLVKHRPLLTAQDINRIGAAIQRARAQAKENLTDKPNGSLTEKKNVLDGKGLPKSTSVTGEDTAGENSLDKRPGGGLGIKGGAVTPNQYRDTYAGDRINGSHEMDTHNFGGTGSGQKSDQPSYADLNQEEVSLMEDTFQAVQENEGGGSRWVCQGSPQEDMAEAAYAMAVGAEIYQETAGMTWGQRAEYINNMAKEQMAELTKMVTVGGRENPDADPSGSFHLFGTPAMREAQLRVINRALAAHKQKAGGGQDPRTQQDNGAGGQLNIISKDDRLQRTKEGGKLDWDLICRINAVVNPPRQ